MSVFLRGRIYTIEFRLPGVAKVFKRSSGETDRRKAEAAERAWRVEIMASMGQAQPAEMTLGAALVRYASTIIAPRTDNLRKTQTSTLSLLGIVERHFGKETPLHQITTAKVSTFRDAHVARGLKPSSVNRYLACLRSVLKLAHEEWGALKEVPRITELPMGPSRVEFLTPPEEAKLIEACKAEPELYDLILFTLDTGCRRSEALRLAPEDFKREHNLVHFRWTKTKKARYVPLTPRAREILERRCVAGQRVFLWDASSGAHPLGRKGRAGRKCEHRSFRGAWMEALTRAGLEGYHWHDTRHQSASKMAARGASLQAIGAILGHSKADTTKIYAHLQPAHLQATVNLLIDQSPAAATSRGQWAQADDHAELACPS